MRKIEITKEQLTNLVNQNLTNKQMAEALNISAGTIRKRLAKFGLKSKGKANMTDESKRLISNGRKAWLANNPDKHPWRNKSKYKSAPCEKLKQWLSDNNFIFVSEYQPLLHIQKSYSIDISFPDKKIGIEVNGNQHYEKDGSLKPYYQKRHNEIEAEGWKIYELHYSICYSLENLRYIILEIINSQIKVAFDYTIKFKKLKPKISDINPNWRHRPNPHKRKVVRPSYEILKQELHASNFTQLGKKYNVSDNAIRKWIKQYEKELKLNLV